MDEITNKTTLAINKIQLCLFFAIIFLLLYSIQFFYLPNSVWLVSIFCFFFIIFKKIDNSSINKITIVSLSLILNIIYITTSLIANNSSDFSLITNNILVVIVHFIFLSLFIISKKKLDSDYAIKIISDIILFQAICIIGYYSLALIKNVFDSLLPYSGNIKADCFMRSRGFSNSPSSGLSVIQAIGLLFNVYLYEFSSLRRQKPYKYFIYVLITLSIVLSGRTGLLIIPFIVIYLTICYFKSLKMMLYLIKLILIFILTITLLLSTVFFIVFNYADSSTINIINLTSEWVLFNFQMNSNTEQSKTTVWEVLYNMIIIPDENLFIFGNIDYYNIINKKSDLGYIRNLWGLGIVGCFIWYSNYLIIAIYSVSNILKPQKKLLIFLVFLYLFLVESKEPYLRSLSINVLVLYIYWFISNKSSRSNHENFISYR